jgi:hypothetical protein
MGLFEDFVPRFGRRTAQAPRNADEPSAADILEAMAPLLAREAAPASVEREPCGTPETPLRLSSRQVGRYVVTDARDRYVGTIRGDFGVGFTLYCWDLVQWFPSLEEAKSAIAAEAESRAAASASASS